MPVANFRPRVIRRLSAILASVSGECFFPLWRAEICAFCASLIVLPLCIALILARVASDRFAPICTSVIFRTWSAVFFRPLCIALSFARCSGVRFVPAGLPAITYTLKPVRGDAEFNASIQCCSRGSSWSRDSTISIMENSNADSPCLSHDLCSAGA